jgi:DNA-directed RNA polymerase specialized sigma24 family protein
MIEDKAPAKRRRLGAHGMMFRRRRVFARLREGFTYDEIAAEEGVSSARVRQIVSGELQKRAVDSGADHAKLQLDRLAPAVQLGAEAIAAGDISAINPYLKALDRLDRYQSVASANQVYDDEARQKLLAKINRIADNLGVDEVMRAASREHRRRIGALHEDELGEAERQEADPAGSPEFTAEANAPETSPAEAGTGSGFLYLDGP